MIEASGGVVLRLHAGQVEALVVHRPAYDDWSLPKGHLEPGEDAVAAAVREVLEETGVTVEPVGTLPSTTYTTSVGPKRVAWFLLRPIAGDPALRIPDAEVDEARWAPVRSLPGLLTYPNDMDVVRAAVALRTDSGGPSTPHTPLIDADRVRYRREVGPEHVGQRVSLRFLRDDGDGPRPTDRVGRLLSFESDGILLVDRAGTLHAIDPTVLLASRLVPPHPRAAPEPTGGTQTDPLVRSAARVLLLDPADHVLLIAHLPGDGHRVWTAPGGGLDPGEDHATAARRELFEEVGVRPTLEAHLWTRTATFSFRGVWLTQHEQWFLARTDAFDANDIPLHDLATSGARWWSLDEMETTTEVLAPADLAQHVADLLRAGPPPTPLHLDH
jgi:8-oxo-dGTP pyrophosphatase MutT (NUDIX family)